MAVILEGDKTLVRSLKGKLDFLRENDVVLVRLKRSNKPESIEWSAVSPDILDIEIGSGLNVEDMTEMIAEFISVFRRMDYKEARAHNKRLYGLKKAVLEGKK
jgi:hypothetical protein